MTKEGQRPDIREYSLEELALRLSELGEPKFRAAQLYDWLHKRHVRSFSEMTNLSKSLRDKLSEGYRITYMKPIDILSSKLDGTKKYIFALYDGNVIEAVLMRYKFGNSVCISSQAGCRMGCKFCASTLEGLSRNLTAAEMLSEIYEIENDIGERVSHVVIMGSGEPLDNYAEVLRFLKMVSDKNGINISGRNITLSTCGLVPRIYELLKEDLKITLALSLHAPSQEKRLITMPIAKSYELKDVLKACKDYEKVTGRRVSYEYAVVRDLNDSDEDAELLSRLLGRGAHVNLIPVNPVTECGFSEPPRKRVYHFQELLVKNGLNATVRREMGRDINSACGQLRRRYISNAGNSTD